MEPKQHKSDIAKEKIMQAMLRVATREGLVNTRTAEIAREAGVSEGLLFKYFPSKNQLFEAVVGKLFRHFRQGLESIITDRKLTATDKLAVLVDFHFNFFSTEYNIGQLVFSRADRKILDLDIGPVFEYGIKPYVQFITGILKEGMAVGEFRLLNPEVVATAMIGTMQIVLVNKLVFHNSVELEAAKKEVKEYILTGVRSNVVESGNKEEESP